MPTPQHLIPVVKRIQSLEQSPPPEPWTLRVDAIVGGLTDVGFAPRSDMLLVVSSQGRGVFDCLTGDRVARDPNDDDSYHYVTELLVDGIGPLEHSQVSLAGLHGGGLAKCTADGWSVDDFVLDWPEHILLLNGLHSWPFDLNGQLWRIGAEAELRAWGFSPTGNSLVFASSSGLKVWARAPTESGSCP